jgi:hypothetical protein
MQTRIYRYLYIVCYIYFFDVATATDHTLRIIILLDG